ncbi:MAG: hypothetical protein KF841_08045 [Phycisphaerae bacterium]|nr:hypothetical protein [Phycisphaerae bacterium]
MLIDSYDGDEMCHDLLAELQAQMPLSDADAALAAELAIGVSRNRITCEHLAAKYYRGRWIGLPVGLRMIVAVGIYQICWLDRIPEYAAVDESVKMSRRYGKGAAAVANAVLRHVAEVRGAVIPRADELSARRFLPLDVDHGRLFTDDVFPDPSRRPLDHLIAVYAHPPWLVERWHRRFKPALCRAILAAGQRRPVLALRANRLRTNPKALSEALNGAGIRAEIASDGEGVLIREAAAASKLEAMRAGLCQPQDATARVAIRLANPKPGEFVLDLCAGVGTKSTQAAERMDNSGVVLATDINTAKLKSIESAADRLGISIIGTSPLDELDSAIANLGKRPDVIVVDAPCSNTGVLARRPEARYRAGRRSLDEVAEIQAGILDRAGELAGPNTRIVYSTCSLEREENEDQVTRFLAGHPEWTAAETLFTLPSADFDGGFAALLRRTDMNE